MARKTPPVARQVVSPRLASSARFQARLIDFDTGSHQLEAQHKIWLRTHMLTAASNSMYRIRLVGYASKVGDAARNSNLSYARIDATLKCMQSVDRHAMQRTETFRAIGEEGYSASESDDSADWRAVEAHVFIGDVPPPPPPPNLEPNPHALQPLPGGPRFTQWQVASPGGAFVAAAVGGGFNIFLIKNVKLDETRGYIQPVGGLGASISMQGLKMAWHIIQQILTGVQYSNMEFTSVTSKLPVTWKEMEDCLVRATSIGGGVVVGVSVAFVTFTAAGVWQYSPSGFPVKLPGGDLFQFKSTGKSWQLGAGGSVVTGPLVRVDA
jgi:hypothetical protein